MSFPLTPDLKPPQAPPQTEKLLPIVDFLVEIFFLFTDEQMSMAILKRYANDNVLLLF